MVSFFFLLSENGRCHMFMRCKGFEKIIREEEEPEEVEEEREDH